jgi:pantothenate kinase
MNPETELNRLKFISDFIRLLSVEELELLYQSLPVLIDYRKDEEDKK